MTDPISFPPLHDLPAGELATRKKHLLSEITREPERRLLLPNTPPFKQRRSWRPIVVVAIAVAALAGAALAIAAGFGAFNGISAAEHPPTAADKLDPAVAASLESDNPLGLEVDSARFVTQLPDGVRIYAVATKTGELCVLAERLPNNNGKNDAAGMGCGSPLTQSQPTTIASFQANESTPPISYGIALDSVTAVSFMAGGQEVTLPVKNNVWAYEGDNSAINSLTVHFDDGSTKTIG